MYAHSYYELTKRDWKSVSCDERISVFNICRGASRAQHYLI